MELPLVTQEFPRLASELTVLRRNEGEADLAAQVEGLRLFDRCRCGDEYCAMMYTAPPPDGAWGHGHDCVVLTSETIRELVLDVVDQRIVAIEILFENEMRDRLATLFP